MYVSYINDIGHQNNYFYMRVLQGSCKVINSYCKQFLAFCRSVRQTFHKKEFTVMSINKLMVYKYLQPPFQS